MDLNQPRAPGRIKTETTATNVDTVGVRAERVEEEQEEAAATVTARELE